MTNDAATVLDTIPIIDVDAHITEPADLWTSRAPAKFRERVPRVVDVDGAAMWSIDGVVLGRALGASVIKRGRVKTPGTEFMRWDPSENDPSAYDMALRLEVMDEMGVQAQILYPNAAGFGAQRFGEIRDPELQLLCATLFNDAMQEIQEESGGRLLPMPLLPWWDIDASVAEATRCAANGFRGVNMCSDPQSRGLPDLGSREWDPLWEVCSDQQLPVNFHIGASETSLTWFGTSPWPSQDDERKLAIGSAMMYLSNARIIANLIYAGVLERFPDLDIVSVESGVGWLPFFLESLDYQQTESAPNSVDLLSMKPSDYFRRQIYACFWFEIPILPSVLEVLGDDHVMFETDYPHPTCLYPDPRARLAELEGRIGEASLRKVLHSNAAALYRIPAP